MYVVRIAQQSSVRGDRHDPSRNVGIDAQALRRQNGRALVRLSSEECPLALDTAGMTRWQTPPP